MRVLSLLPPHKIAARQSTCPYLSRRFCEVSGARFSNQSRGSLKASFASLPSRPTRRHLSRRGIALEFQDVALSVTRQHAISQRRTNECVLALLPSRSRKLSYEKNGLRFVSVLYSYLFADHLSSLANNIDLHVRDLNEYGK